MAKWIFRVGILLMVIGGVLLSPLADLLPVEVWFWMGFPKPTHTQMYLIVEGGEVSRTFEWTLTSLGAALGLLGHLLPKFRSVRDDH